VRNVLGLRSTGLSAGQTECRHHGPLKRAVQQHGVKAFSQEDELQRHINGDTSTWYTMRMVDWQYMRFRACSIIDKIDTFINK
jgi:hypothetical protein